MRWGFYFVLHNRIGIDLTYYHMLDENSIIELPISSASAFTKRYVNGNEYTTNGFELIVSATPVKTKLYLECSYQLE